MRSQHSQARSLRRGLLVACLMLLPLLVVETFVAGDLTAADLSPVGASTATSKIAAQPAGQPLLDVVGKRAQIEVPQVAMVSDCRKGYVALTFDDGPSIFTPNLVKTLERLGVPATFFIVGYRIKEHRKIVRRVRDAGFTIGSHTWDHANLLALRPKQVMRELRSTNHALAADGVGQIQLFRPPYGLTNDRIRKQARALGMSHVMWTADSNDWRGGGPHQIANRVLAQLRPHTPNIVLQHDGLSRSMFSIRAVPIIVKRAAKRGYCFTSLDQRGNLITPHHGAPAPGSTPTPTPLPAPTNTLVPAP
ncbi:MAG: polysaccharide deacetylase family protein [Nocardioidaceae bacterium]|nr:polysaccharide deacetylase family protein [Marmoricola sp.]